MKEQYATLGANVVVELYSESHARQPTTRAWAINRQADRNHRPLWPWGWSRWCWCCSQTGGPPRRASDRWPGRLWSSVWSDRLCDLGERRTAGDRCEPLGSDGVWPRRGPGAPRSRGVAALRVADLGWQGDPGRLPPTSEPAMAIALLGGALAGSGPGTSPCVDGLSLVSGKVVPQNPERSNHTEDDGWLGGDWPSEAAQSWCQEPGAPGLGGRIRSLCLRAGIAVVLAAGPRSC